MKISNNLPIKGKKILLVGFRGNKNMGDELILIGTIKLLLKQDKTPIVVSQNPEFLRSFCAQFLDISKVIFIYELPRGFRSTIHYLQNKEYKNIGYYYKCDSIILGGGEILTEENPNAYRYRRYSMRGKLISSKINLYIMGGVQIPKKKVNQRLFKFLVKRTQHFYLRDFDAISELKEIGIQNSSFFMDTSYFCIEDRKKYKKKENKYIVINLNSNAEKFFGKIFPIVQEYNNKGFTIYYLPICKGNDNDNTYLQWFIDRGIHKKNIKKIDREESFDSCLSIIANATKVIGTRLHLFLISRFLKANIQTFPYQRKIIKMQKTLKKIQL